MSTCFGTGGEPLLGLPALIHFPWYSHEQQQQLFPYRTAIMAGTFVVHLTVSRLAELTFTRRWISGRFDFLHCFQDAPAGAAAAAAAVNGGPISLAMKETLAG